MGLRPLQPFMAERPARLDRLDETQSKRRLSLSTQHGGLTA